MRCAASFRSTARDLSTDVDPSLAERKVHSGGFLKRRRSRVLSEFIKRRLDVLHERLEVFHYLVLGHLRVMID